MDEKNIEQNATTENNPQPSLIDVIYDLQDTVESMLLAGCGDCGWEGPFWRLLPGNVCPICRKSEIISAFEANEIERFEAEQGEGQE